LFEKKKKKKTAASDSTPSSQVNSPSLAAATGIAESVPLTVDQYRSRVDVLARRTFVGLSSATPSKASWEGSNKLRLPAAEAFFTYVEHLPLFSQSSTTLTALIWSHRVIYQGVFGVSKKGTALKNNKKPRANHSLFFSPRQSLQEGCRHLAFFEKIRDQCNQRRISLTEQKPISMKCRCDW
jgi:hypothetical protein